MEIGRVVDRSHRAKTRPPMIGERSARPELSVTRMANNKVVILSTIGPDSWVLDRSKKVENGSVVDQRNVDVDEQWKRKVKKQNGIECGTGLVVIGR